MMMRSPYLLTVALAVLVSNSGAASDKQPPIQQRNFVACPVVRDTKTVPCWLAEYRGEMYYLGIQQDIGADFYPPQLNHQVLVEGTVSEGPRVCGGIPLKPVHASVLQEIDRSCNTILPAEEDIDAPPALRGPGPSSKRDSLNAAPSPPPASPQPPYHAREFKIFFDFDSDYLPGRSTRVVGQAAGYAKLTKATAIEVSGYRGATLLSDGRRLEEKPNAGEVRAKKIAEILEGLGIPAVNVAVHWKSKSPPADGVNDPLLREVIISVKPLAAGSEP